MSATLYGRVSRETAWRRERAAELRSERLTDLERLLEAIVDAYDQAEALGMDGSALDAFAGLVRNEIIKIETGHD